MKQKRTIAVFALGILIVLGGLFVFPLFSVAQSATPSTSDATTTPAGAISSAVESGETGTIPPDITTIEKAKVTEIVSQYSQVIPGTDVQSTYQNIIAQVLSGPDTGQSIVITDDYLNLKAGDVFYAEKDVDGESGLVSYSESDAYRLPAVFFFVGLFILCVLFFGGWQGIRGLLSLAGSLALIIFVLLPSILHGYSPLLMSFGVAFLIIVLGSYITHGFNKTTTAAVAGMIITVLLTGALAYVAVKTTQLSGYNTEEAVYLNLSTQGTINFQQLLLGGILIGLLGVLYDIAISQAITVEELHAVAPHLPRRDIFKRSIRIGREHIGALVNTLAIAYVGVSLPLLLLFYTYTTTSDIASTINKEIFSTEIIRTMIGSIGLVIAVPIVTTISILMLIKAKKLAPADAEEIKEEKHALEHFEHHH